MLAAAWSDGLNHVALFAFPVTAERLRDEALRPHCVQALEKLLETAREWPDMPGNTPSFVAGVEKLLSAASGGNRDSPEIAALAREVIEGTGILPPGGWRRLEEHVLKTLNPMTE